MKTIQSGNSFRIYDNSMSVYDRLPAKVYSINFEQNAGFSLSLCPDIIINEKIYGEHEEKINKVLNSFKLFKRNMGVILSGDKGIGKSLFSKRLAQKVIELGIPVIVVNSYIPGIAEYINTIEQEVVILFDEFDKTFRQNIRQAHTPQEEMLTLFDGIFPGKKLFVITCNDLNGLDTFIINRPGRFHYHFRFEYPTSNDIHKYLMDNLDEKYQCEINSVISFSQKVNLNYDCLRAIAFELNTGLTFKEAIKDLNILNLGQGLFVLTLVLDNGEKLLKAGEIDLFSQKKTTVDFREPEEDEFLYHVTYIPSSGSYDKNNDCYSIDVNNLKVELAGIIQNPRMKHCERLYNKYKNVKAICMKINKMKNKNINYIL